MRYGLQLLTTFYFWFSNKVFPITIKTYALGNLCLVGLNCKINVWRLTISLTCEKWTTACRLYKRIVWMRTFYIHFWIETKLWDLQSSKTFWMWWGLEKIECAIWCEDVTVICLIVLQKSEKDGSKRGRNQCFDHLKIDMKNADPNQLINLNVTNLSDDSGYFKCIAKKVQKYLNRIVSGNNLSCQFFKNDFVWVPILKYNFAKICSLNFWLIEVVVVTLYFWRYADTNALLILPQS